MLILIGAVALSKELCLCSRHKAGILLILPLSLLFCMGSIFLYHEACKAILSTLCACREAEEVVGASQAVVFLGGHPTKLMAYAVEELLTWYPFVPVEKSMQV